MHIGYARFSPKELDKKDDLAQIKALENVGCDSIVRETASGGRWDRPELNRILSQLAPGDVIVVWKLERLSRSLTDLMIVLGKIEAAKAHFKSLTEMIDTSSPAGGMMMGIVSSFTEFERAMLKQRTNAGLETARREGRVGGRRSKLTRQQQQEIIALVSSGQKTGAEAARLFQIHPSTVTRLLSRQNSINA